MHPEIPLTVGAEPKQRDRGFTLPEVVVAIGLTGMLILSIIAGVRTLIQASSVSDNQAAVEAALGSAADELAVAGWQSCPVETGAYLQTAQQGAAHVDWPTSAIQIESIMYWDISSNDWSPNNPFASSGTCQMVPTVAAASRMQKVTIRATAPSSPHSRSLDVVVAEISFLDDQDSP